MNGPLSIASLVPEIGIMGGICTLIAMECVQKWKKYVAHMAIILCCVAGGAILARVNPGIHGMFIHDAFTSFSQIFCLIVMGALILWNKQQSTEWLALMLACLLGMFLTAASYDFLMLFLALELVSMPLYAMMATHRYRSQEAALKYIILSALMGAVYLYSVSWIYGLTGSTHFGDIHQMIPLIASDTRVTFAVIGIKAAIAFKCAVVPFHIWAGDVYHGSPTPLLIVLAGLPKWITFMAWMRVITVPFSGVQDQISSIFMGLAIFSMFLGSLVALKQSDIKRLLAYSSIGHMGFTLLGFINNSAAGFKASTIYISLYVITLTMLIGVWNLIKSQPVTSVGIRVKNSLEKLAHARGTLGSVVFVILLLSMAGIPPTPGFIAKWIMIKSLIQQRHTYLATLAVIYSVISVAYTLNLIRIMYGAQNDIETKKSETHQQKLSLIFSMLTLASIMIFPRPFMSWITCAINSLMMTSQN